MGQSSSVLPSTRAVGGAHPEVLLHEAPGHGAVAERAAADAGGVVADSRPRWAARCARGRRGRPPRAGCARRRDRTRCPGRVVRWLRRSSLRQSKAEYHLPRSSSTTLRPACGQFLGHDAAAGAGADHHRVDVLQAHGCLPSVLSAAAADWGAAARRASSNSRRRGCRRGAGRRRSPAWCGRPPG